MHVRCLLRVGCLRDQGRDRNTVHRVGRGWRRRRGRVRNPTWVQRTCNLTGHDLDRSRPYLRRFVANDVYWDASGRTGAGVGRPRGSDRGGFGLDVYEEFDALGVSRLVLCPSLTRLHFHLSRVYSGDKMVDGVCYTCALEGYVVDDFVVERDQVVTCTCTPLCESASCLTRAALILPCIVSDGVGGDDE